MSIFEVTIPGTWLNYEDQEWTFRISNLLFHLQSQFFEANVALNLFVQASAISQMRREPADWLKNNLRRAEIAAEVERELGTDRFSAGKRADVSFETDVRFKREMWSKGEMPNEFRHAKPFIYARAFLYALDAFDKFLGVLSQESGVPSELASLHGQVATRFPQLRAVRNSAQHLEDRVRGLGVGNKMMDLKPIENQLISTPNGGALVLNALNGSKYGATMADGHYGEVDVSPESMEHLQVILHGVLELFLWAGPKTHMPSAPI
ncbi:hypothetical protein [Rugamonas rivuli]|uniref:Uncharacterized protein n=1 Tax=Rugamonas rivuli TaxID=2743358 RepID=A0A843SIP3_9BURK|nr:hypothetical protein [Rugamonas rivuli]MQA21844.1 hypothetical protein [Rugamonas rivuli]